MLHLQVHHRLPLSTSMDCHLIYYKMATTQDLTISLTLSNFLSASLPSPSDPPPPSPSFSLPPWLVSYPFHSTHGTHSMLRLHASFDIICSLHLNFVRLSILTSFAEFVLITSSSRIHGQPFLRHTIRYRFPFTHGSYLFPYRSNVCNTSTSISSSQSPLCNYMLVLVQLYPLHCNILDWAFISTF